MRGLKKVMKTMDGTVLHMFSYAFTDLLIFPHNPIANMVELLDEWVLGKRTPWSEGHRTGVTSRCSRCSTRFLAAGLTTLMLPGLCVILICIKRWWIITWCIPCIGWALPDMWQHLVIIRCYVLPPNRFCYVGFRKCSGGHGLVV